MAYNHSSNFDSEYGKNLQVGTINTQYKISDINNIISLIS